MPGFLPFLFWSMLLLGLPALTAAQVSPLSYLDELPPLLDRELFFGDPEYSGAQISPDGRHITFVRPHQGVRNIWIKGVDESFEEARPLTADTARPVTGYFWSRDARFVLYVQDKGGDENYHVYALDPDAAPAPDTGVPPARNLTPSDGARALVYALPKEQPHQILVGLNDRDPRWHDLYRINLDTGSRELLRENTEEIADWTFDLSGILRLASRSTVDGSTQILRVESDQSLTPVYECSVFETCVPIRYHPNGRQVYMITNRGESTDLIRLVLFNPETGEETLVEADPENEVDFAGAEFSNATDELLATYYVGDRRRIYPKDPEFSAMVTMLQERFPEGEVSFGAKTSDDARWLIHVSSDVDPGSSYLFDRSTGESTLLYRSRPNLPSNDLAPMRSIRYAARDGVEVQAYLTVPPGVEAEDLAVAVFPHGGPWARDMWGYNSFAQFLANRGYAVLQPNFRGSTGFGKEFLNLGNAEWGTGTMQHDITDGVQYLIDEGIADPQRVAIMGISYGGYATLAGLTFTPDLYAAGVSIVGPSNLITLLNTIPPYWAAIRDIFNVRVGDPSDPEDAERLRAQSPFFHADRIRVPLLVIQGANDPRVRQAESDQIVVAARDNEVDVQYLVAPDEGHGFAGRENRIAMITAIEQFLAERIGGRHQETMPADIAERLELLRVDVATVTLPERADADELGAALPELDGDVIRPSNFRYQASMQVGGQSVDLEISRSFEEATRDGRAVWRAIEQMTMPPQFGGMTTVDTFDVDRSTVLPIARHARSMGTMKFTYEPDRVHGSLSGAGQQIPVDVQLDQPILGDGPALELAIAAMPLQPDYSTIVRYLNPVQGEVRTARLSVEGRETVSTRAGEFDVLRVNITPIDGDEAGTQALLVLADAPHFVIRSEQTLPPAMGGGTMTTELLWMD